MEKDTTGGEWSKMAETMDSAKLDNACPHPVKDYDVNPTWHRLANTDDPFARVRG